MPSQASSSKGSEKNKNLIAAKASLGLSTTGSTSSSYRKNPVKRNSISSVSTSVSGSASSNESSRKFPASSSSTRSSSTAGEGNKSILRNSDNNSNSSSKRARFDETSFSKSYDSHVTNESGSKVNSSARFDETSFSKSNGSHVTNESGSKVNSSARFDETSFSKSNGSHVTNESGSKVNSSFDSYFEDKIDQSENASAESLQSIKEESSEVPHEPGTNITKSNELFDSNTDSNTNLSQYQGSGYDSKTNFSQGSELYNSNNMYDSNTDFSQEGELNDSYNDTAVRSVDENSQRSREDFVPQRFDEMRTLLSAITPMQLEALIQEIFGNDGPPGWNFKGKKSKRGFRKDAYLSELSLEELRNFARRIDNLGLDYCWSKEEALDLIAVEFERLVSLRLNGDDESDHMSSPHDQNYAQSSPTVSFEEGQMPRGRLESLRLNEDDESNHMSSPHDQNYVQSSSSVSYEEDQMTRDSGTSEGDNLRRSLRACSFAELQLVAERLRLDPSLCVTKDELILMIENSMSDLLADAVSQDSQSQPWIENHSNYYQPIQQQHHRQQQQHRLRSNRGERRKKVKFSDGEKRRKVKFANDTKEGKAQPMSTRKGNFGDGQDLESAPLVQTNGGKGSSRLSGLRTHIWKIVGLILLLVLIIGLSFGLSGRDSRGDEDVNGEGRPYLLLPENDPFFSEFSASSLTSAPSSKPSQSNADSETTDSNEGQPSSTSGSVFVTNLKPTAYPSSSTYMSILTDTETKAPTQSVTAQPTRMPTLMPTDANQIETGMPSTHPTQQPITTTQPTPLSPYPLLGPYEEAGMRMVLYGISELSEMGRTQFKMLTAAYVEQFYNDEGRGTDAFQNIVFDVAASIEITNVEPPPTRRRGRGVRSLQSGILIITFTMNLSYRSFINDLDAKTVSERPFFEESMHADFVQFLRDNNAARFVGDVSDITSIFRGDDIPEIINPLVQEENSPVEEDLRVESNSPSRNPVAVAAAKPTPEDILAAKPPTSLPAFYQTPSPTRQSANLETNKPKPTPGKVIHTYSPVK